MSQAIAGRSATQVTAAYDTQDSSSTLPARWLGSVRLWTERYRQRQALFNLAEANTHLLDDIGLSRNDALREAAKPFWRR
jgi:uncharacterized protein YjiS (DUF1127 family)